MTRAARAVLLLGSVLGLDSAWAAGSALPLDGRWSAVSDGLGGTLAVELRVAAGAVSGAGTQRRGALPERAFEVSGSYRAPQAVLTFRYRDGATVRFEGSVVDAERMPGRLFIDGSGSTVAVEFVRP